MSICDQGTEYPILFDVSIFNSLDASVNHAHAVPIEITNNGMDYTSNKVQFTVLPESNVTFVHPSFGAVGASTSVTVHGSGFVFSRSLYCRFGLLSVAAMYVNSTTVVCTAPDAAEGVVDVRVSSNGVDYSSSNATYEYVDAHHVHDVLPRSGSVNGGTLLNVSGTGFKNTSVLYCRFGSLPPVAGLYLTSTRVQCISPMHQIGSVSIEVTTNGVDYSEDMVQYRYYASPAVSHVVPSSGPTDGGTVISVYGRNFIDSDSLNCRFGNESVVSGRWVSSDRVECESPKQYTGRLTLKIANNGVDYVSCGFYTFYYGALKFNIIPHFAASSGGTQVRLHLYQGAVDPFDSLKCRFGVFIVDAVFVNSTTILCTAPMHDLGTASVALSRNGIDFAKSQTTLLYIETPEFYRMSPDFGSTQGGDKVYITGANIHNISGKCKFGTSPFSKLVFINSTTAYCITPPHASGRAMLNIRYEHLEAALLVAGGKMYTYEDTPYIAQIYPTHGCELGGTNVRVMGAFLNGLTRWFAHLMLEV